MSGFVSTWFNSPKLVCKSRTVSENIQTKSGCIYLQVEKNGAISKYKVYMKVFKPAFNDHYAQIFTDETCCFMYGCLSLRKCVVKQIDSKQITIQTHGKDIENKGFTFEAISEHDVSEWIQTLTPIFPVSHLSPLLARHQYNNMPIGGRSVDTKNSSTTLLGV